MQSLYPKNLARFYDVIYNQQRDSVDHDFYLTEIKKATGKVLDVGVGTGRFFMDALHKGADIFGIDISPTMIDVLYQKMDRSQFDRISLQNIIDFHFNFKFSLIVAPFRVMMHLQDKEQQLMALNNVFDHLSSHGKFIFDVFVPDLNYLLNGFKNFTDFEGEYENGKMLKRIIHSKADLVNQKIEVKFDLEWDENMEKKHEEWIVPMRFFFRYELEHLIERSKFKNYKILGDFEGNKLNQNSKEFIVICQK